MLYIIGLGLGDEQDITLKGLEAVKKCHKVYMEAYTSLLSFGLSTNGISNLVPSFISHSFLIPLFFPTPSNFTLFIFLGKTIR